MLKYSHIIKKFMSVFDPKYFKKNSKVNRVVERKLENKFKA